MRKQIFRAADFDSGYVEPERAGHCLNFFHFQGGCGITYIGHDPYPTQTGNKLAQDLEPLTGDISGLD